MKYRYYLDAAIQYLIISLVYPSVEATAMANRPVACYGGEVGLWLIPLLFLFVRWCKAYDRERARKNG